MKKKFNLYCGLLIAAIVFGIGLTMFETGYRMYQSGKKGWELAEKDHMTGVKRDPSWGINLMNRLTPVEMMPKGELLIGMNVNDSIVNLKTGEKMPMMTVQALVLPENGQNRMRVMQGISLIGGGPHYCILGGIHQTGHCGEQGTPLREEHGDAVGLGRMVGAGHVCAGMGEYTLQLLLQRGVV